MMMGMRWRQLFKIGSNPNGNSLVGPRKIWACTLPVCLVLGGVVGLGDWTPTPPAWGNGFYSAPGGGMAEATLERNPYAALALLGNKNIKDRTGGPTDEYQVQRFTDSISGDRTLSPTSDQVPLVYRRNQATLKLGGNLTHQYRGNLTGQEGITQFNTEGQKIARNTGALTVLTALSLNSVTNNQIITAFSTSGSATTTLFSIGVTTTGAIEVKLNNGTTTSTMTTAAGQLTVGQPTVISVVMEWNKQNGANAGRVLIKKDGVTLTENTSVWTSATAANTADAIPLRAQVGAALDYTNALRADMGGIIYYDKALTEVEETQERTALRRRLGMGARQIYFVGDSNTEGYGHAYPAYKAHDRNRIHQRVRSLLGTEGFDLVHNRGSYGETAQAALASLSISSYSLADGYQKIAVLGWGRNDIAASRTPAQVYADIQALATAFRGAGWKVVVRTVIPINDASQQANVNTLNGLIRTGFANATLDADALSDIAVLPIFNDDQDCLNTTYFTSDRVHLTAEGTRQWAIKDAEAIQTLN